MMGFRKRLGWDLYQLVIKWRAGVEISCLEAAKKQSDDDAWRVKCLPRLYIRINHIIHEIERVPRFKNMFMQCLVSVLCCFSFNSYDMMPLPTPDSVLFRR